MEEARVTWIMLGSSPDNGEMWLLAVRQEDDNRTDKEEEGEVSLLRTGLICYQSLIITVTTVADQEQVVKRGNLVTVPLLMLIQKPLFLLELEVAVTGGQPDLPPSVALEVVV